MKKFFFLVLFLLITTIIFAQKQIYVWQDGVRSNYAVIDVDSITFCENMILTENMSDAQIAEHLLGIWLHKTYSSHVQLTFGQNGMLEYFLGPIGDETWSGMRVHLTYHVTDRKLFIAHQDTTNHGTDVFDYYSTDIALYDTLLTIDRLSKDGVVFKKLTFEKK